MKKFFVFLLLVCIMLTACGAEESTEVLEQNSEPLTATMEAFDTIATEAPEEEHTEATVVVPVDASDEYDGYVSVNETVYTTTDVNVRTGPGTDFDKVGRIAAGSAIVRIGIGDNGWSKVIYEGETCFMSSNYLTTENPEEANTVASTEVSKKQDDGFTSVDETVYATTDVNVRTGPSTDYDKVGRIPQGQAVHRIGVSNDGWSKVIYEGETCYISSKYLSATKPSETSKEETKTEMVWVSKTGSKYHSKSSCSNMKNPSQITKETAIARGLKPCSKCH